MFLFLLPLHLSAELFLGWVIDGIVGVEQTQ